MNESMQAMKAREEVELKDIQADQTIDEEDQITQMRPRGNSLADKLEEFKERTHE